jgi:cytochrome c oxidase cbb3-type subunit 3
MIFAMQTLLILMLTHALLPVTALAQKAASPAAVEAGKQIYLGSCSACHGASGEGSQGPSLLSGRVRRLKDPELAGVIKNGLPGTTMPNSDLPDDKIRNVVSFLRSLTAPAISANVSGDAARGKSLFFAAAKCSTCHMIVGQGGYPGPDLSNIGAERTVHQLRESILSPSNRIEAGFRGASATLPSGEKIEGVAKSFNNYSVQLLDNKGRLHLLDRTKIKDVEIKEMSSMPPANPADAADLIAFLARQATRFNSGDAQ